MPFDRVLESAIANVLKDYDIQGTRGAQLFPTRTSSLVKVLGTSLTDEKLVLIVDQIAPEGLGQNLFWNSGLAVPMDATLNSGLLILWNDSCALPPLGSCIWLRNVIDLGSFPEDYTFDEFSFWMKAKDHSDSIDTVHHLEMFAGGAGGWSAAARFLHSCTGAKIQSVAIEIDEKVAKAFALANHACFIKPDRRLPHHTFHDFHGTWIVCTDIANDLYIEAAADWRVDIVTISSPCQPWSGASTGLGFESEDGQALLHAVLQCRWIRPVYILFENVGGFARHDHKRLLLKVLQMCGYKLCWEQCLDTQVPFGFVRGRWLAIAVRLSDHIQPTVHTWELFHHQLIIPSVLCIGRQGPVGLLWPPKPSR